MKGKNATNLAPDTVAALPQELRRRWNGANQVLIWKPRSKIWKGPTQLQFHLFISFTSLLQFVGFHLFSKLCLSVLFFAACSFSCMLSCFIVRHQVSQSESGVSYRIYRAWERTICLFIDCGLAIVIVCFFIASLLLLLLSFCLLFVRFPIPPFLRQESWLLENLIASKS